MVRAREHASYTQELLTCERDLRGTELAAKAVAHAFKQGGHTKGRQQSVRSKHRAVAGAKGIEDGGTLRLT